MNWFQKTYGKGFGPIGAVIFILAFAGIMIYLSEWWIGIVIILGFAFLFWTQRNTV